MKKLLKIASITLVLLSIIVGCTKEPKDSKVFIGTYSGMITYTEITKPLEGKIVANGTVTVTKIGKYHSFSFSDGIPDIVAVEFTSSEDGTHTAVGLEKTCYITMSSNSLKMLYIKDGYSWTASCKR